MSKRFKFWSTVAALFAGSTALVYLLAAYIGDELNPMRWTGGGRFVHVVFTLVAWWGATWAAAMVRNYMDSAE